MAKEYLSNRGVEYTDYDVSRDKARGREMMAKSGQRAVPVLEINGRIIVGFRPMEIDRAVSSPKLDKDTMATNVIFDPLDQ